MEQIELALLIKVFHKIIFLNVFESEFKRLEINRAFCARSKSDKDNILSGFRTYISFIREQREKQN